MRCLTTFDAIALTGWRLRYLGMADCTPRILRIWSRNPRSHRMSTEPCTTLLTPTTLLKSTSSCCPTKRLGSSSSREKPSDISSRPMPLLIFCYFTPRHGCEQARFYVNKPRLVRFQDGFVELRSASTSPSAVLFRPLLLVVKPDKAARQKLPNPDKPRPSGPARQDTG